MAFVTLDNEHPEHTTYEIDTNEQIALAKAAMRRGGIESLPVYVGDPEGDSQRNGEVLFADDRQARDRARDGTR